MTAFLIGPTAQAFWRNYDRISASATLLKAVAIEQSVASQQAAEVKAALEISRELDVVEGPVHLLVDTPEKRRTNSHLVAHLCARTLPDGSFCSIEDGVCVASPALTFVEMSKQMPLIDLIEYGYELCGTYSIDQSEDAGFIQGRALTTSEHVARFAAAAVEISGAKRARQAAGHLVDGSASPMETTLSMNLTLPSILDGYQLCNPLLNHRLDISEFSGGAMGRESLVCDLYWPSAKLDVEYDSDMFHLGERQRGLDSSRALVLDQLGVKVISVTRSQMAGVEEFELVVSAIREALGLREVVPDRAAMLRRARLRRYLMTPQHERRLIRY